MINLLSKFLTVLLCLCFTSMLKGQDFVKVDLQDGFDNDTVSLYVNDVEIFKNQVLKSPLSIGETGFVIMFTRKSEKYYYVTQSYPFNRKFPSGNPIYHQTNILCAPDMINVEKLATPNMWNFKVVSKSEIVEKVIDVSKFGYIGITKYGDLEDPFKEELCIVESKTAFLYD
jgi:hypothetical protein